jgi:hypothetical protein
VDLGLLDLHSPSGQDDILASEKNVGSRCLLVVANELHFGDKSLLGLTYLHSLVIGIEYFFVVTQVNVIQHLVPRI